MSRVEKISLVAFLICVSIFIIGHIETSTLMVIFGLAGMLTSAIGFIFEK